MITDTLCKACGSPFKSYNKNPQFCSRQCKDVHLSKHRDLAGRTFGRLSVVSEGLASGTRRRWLCRCECGQTTTVLVGNLVAGTTRQCRSCGARDSATKHGEAINRTLEYTAWNSMKARCHSPGSKDYARYGGSGIAVCQRWRDSFDAFLEDMGRKPSVHHSLDRYPNKTGNYEPGNVRWATQIQQQNNKTSNVTISYRGMELTMTEAARMANLRADTLANRISSGWSIEDAMTKPVRGMPA